MFTLLRYICRRVTSHPRRNVLMIGLDGVGKTSLLNEMRVFLGRRPVLPVMPTTGQNVLKFDFKSVSYTMWDLGGVESFRRAWELYYRECDVVLLVMDASTDDSFDAGWRVFEALVGRSELRHAPFALLLNKSDVECVVTENDVVRRLAALPQAALAEREVKFFFTCGTQPPTGAIRTRIPLVIDWISLITRKDKWARLRTRYRKTLQK